MKSKEIRQKAWNALKGRYWWSVLAALIAGLFGVISLGTSSGTISQWKDSEELVLPGFESLPSKGKLAVFIILGSILIIGLAMSIIGSAIKLGYCRYNLDLFTEVEKPTMNLLFSRTKIIGKALWKSILEGLIVVAGCLLLVVPGIIFGLMYSQSDYILAENPELTAVEAMKRSRAMMKGNKWALFCLAFSFFGWSILAGIVPAGALLLTPYTEASYAAFYLDRKKDS